MKVWWCGTAPPHTSLHSAAPLLLYVVVLKFLVVLRAIWYNDNMVKLVWFDWMFRDQHPGIRQVAPQDQLFTRVSGWHSKDITVILDVQEAIDNKMAKQQSG